MTYTKVFFADNYKLGEASTVFDLLLTDPVIFEKYGVQIVNNIKKCDLVIANQMDCYFTHCKKPIIICSRYDSSSLGASYWNYSNPLVKAVFEDYLPRDKKQLTTPTIQKRYHYAILHDIYGSDFNYDPPIRDIDKYLDKIRQVSWFIPYTHLDMNKHMKICREGRGTVEKDIDIFCIFHKHDKNTILTEHRQSVEDIVSCMTEYTTVYGYGYDQQEYHDTLLRSKICIAPWGFGERIASDQKGILAGCVLLKPDTDFLLSFPDLYNEKYYVKFKQDLSDLKEICENTLNDYDNMIKRTIAGQELFDSVTYDTYVEQFCKNVKEVHGMK